MVAFFEHGEHGNFAAPMVRDVLKAYFDKKTRLTLLQQEKQALQARLSTMAPPVLPGIPNPQPPVPNPR